MVAATLGWVGTVGVLLAYLSVSRGWLAGDSGRYATLNIVGGALGGTASGLYGAWPSAASNFVWALVGVATVTAALRDKRSARLGCRGRPSSVRRALSRPWSRTVVVRQAQWLRR